MSQIKVLFVISLLFIVKLNNVDASTTLEKFTSSNQKFTKDIYEVRIIFIW